MKQGNRSVDATVVGGEFLLTSHGLEKNEAKQGHKTLKKMVNCSTAIILLSLSALARANIYSRNTPDTAIEKFKQKAGFKKSTAPVVHTVGRRSKSFEIEGESVRFDQLVPVSDLFAPGAKVMIDGVEQDPQIFLYESPANPGVKVLLDKRKKLIKASKRKSNGDITDLLRVEGKQFAEFNPKDIDQTQFEGYNTVSSIIVEKHTKYPSVEISNVFPYNQPCFVAYSTIRGMQKLQPVGHQVDRQVGRQVAHYVDCLRPTGIIGTLCKYHRPIQIVK